MLAIRELKQEYLVGSQDAFSYLKAMSEYEKICDNLSKNNNISYKLTPTDIAYLNEGVNVCASYWLDSIVLENLTPDCFSEDWMYFHSLVQDGGESYCQNNWIIDLTKVLSCILPLSKERPEG